MSLYDYKRKRDLSQSGEPAEQYIHNNWPRFVIQKHKASHLHYDLRLEHKGVLKSWAVPKGPTLDPSKKKLAIMVEDHPIEYRNFEGNIPEGNYGAGTVMIWDEGNYHIPGVSGIKETENAFTEQLEKGNLHIFFEGRKLRGSFHLVKINRSGVPNGWLLIKKDDQFASSQPTYTDDSSIRTGRTMDQIRNSSPESSFINFDTKFIATENIRKGKPHSPIQPMLAQLIEEPFDNKDWIFEIKWDGYRAIAETEGEFTRFYSRNGISFLSGYEPVVDDLKKISAEAILDGELVVLDSNGRADFGLLQNYRRSKSGDLRYYIFDLLYLNGFDLRMVPLIKRKKILKQIIPELYHIRYNDHIVEKGIEFFNIAKENKLEGIVAKDSNSTYQEGTRSGKWKKIKITFQQEFVIGGFTHPKGGRSGFGALLLGVYENNDLIYTGSVGGGFSENELHQIYSELSRFTIKNSPFKNTPHFSQITWIKPLLVCEVKFAEWTADGFLRQPIFLGFRNDLDPLEVSREFAVPQKKSFSGKESDDTILQIDNQKIKVSNLGKVYFPSQNITKGDLIHYYREIAPYILPYLIDRPQSLHRFPDGIRGKDFFHKNFEDTPEWVSKVKFRFETGFINYILCQNTATLLYIANLGSIEINVWNSRFNKPDFPDYMVIDLDPLECPFSYVIEVALVVHQILQQIDIPHYIKTSGATGLHIYVPLNAQYSFEQARQYSLIVCTLAHKRLPEITSLERVPEKRRGKVYLDYLQNSKGKTMVAPYSIRPREGAPVSTPLLWTELNNQLSPDQFTIRSIFSRLRSHGDLWKPVTGKGIDMLNSLKRLEALF